MLGAAFQGLYGFDQAVGEKTVGKKRVIRAFHEELVTIVKDVVNGFRIIRVFINPFVHVGLDHIMKNLENLPHDHRRTIHQYFKKFVKRNSAALLQLTHAIAKVLHRFFDSVFGDLFFRNGIFLFFKSLADLFHLVH